MIPIPCYATVFYTLSGLVRINMKMKIATILDLEIGDYIWVKEFSKYDCIKHIDPFAMIIEFENGGILKINKKRKYEFM